MATKLKTVIQSSAKLSLEELRNLRAWVSGQIELREQEAAGGLGAEQDAAQAPAFDARLRVTEDASVPDIPVTIVGDDLVRHLIEQKLADGVCPATKTVCPLLKMPQKPAVSRRSK